MFLGGWGFKCQCFVTIVNVAVYNKATFMISNI